MLGGEDPSLPGGNVSDPSDQTAGPPASQHAPQVCHPASSPPGGGRGQRQGQPPGGGHLCELTATVWWTPFRHPKPVYHSPIFYYRFVLCRRTRPMIYECGLSAQCKSMLLTLFVKILRTYVLSDCSLILQFQSRGIHVKGMTKT